MGSGFFSITVAGRSCDGGKGDESQREGQDTDETSA